MDPLNVDPPPAFADLAQADGLRAQLAAVHERPSIAGVLDRLFAGPGQDSGQVRRELPEALRLGLDEAGLIESGQRVRARVQLRRVDGLWIAADRTDGEAARLATYVPGPGPASRAHAAMLPDTAVESALDLGCGCGYLACRMAGFAGQVVATDLNPRAVAYTRFNAALNGYGTIETAVGDLYQPLAGRRFDLIVSNPPYVISPATDYVYRDGQPGLIRRILDGAAAHLLPGAILQLAANWPHLRGGEPKAEIAAWFRRDDCAAWVITDRTLDAASYARVWLSQGPGDPATLAREHVRWLAYYEQQRIVAIGGGLVYLRPAGAAGPWFDISETPGCRGPGGGSVRAGLAARELLAGLANDQALLEQRLIAAPGLELRSRQSLTAAGWEPARLTLKVTQGLGFSAEVEAPVARLLPLLDGRRCLREAIDRLGGQASAPGRLALRSLPATARRLLAMGLLWPADTVEPR